jgi:hypothetical protein
VRFDAYRSVKKVACSDECAQLRKRGLWRERQLANYAVDPASGCWMWKGATRNGYGIVKVGGREQRAHLLFWEHHRGPFPSGLVPDHDCHVTRCVNPWHITPRTAGDNARNGWSARMDAHRAGTCLRGHAMTDANTITYPSGVRACRTCREAKRRAQHPTPPA